MDVRYPKLTEKELLQQLEHSRKQVENGQTRRADEVIQKMRERYEF